MKSILIHYQPAPYAKSSWSRKDKLSSKLEILLPASCAALFSLHPKTSTHPVSSALQIANKKINPYNHSPAVLIRRRFILFKKEKQAKLLRLFNFQNNYFQIIFFENNFSFSLPNRTIKTIFSIFSIFMLSVAKPFSF